MSQDCHSRVTQHSSTRPKQVADKPQFPEIMLKTNFWPQWLKRERAAAGGHGIPGLEEELDTLRGTICEMGGLAEVGAHLFSEEAVAA